MTYKYKFIEDLQNDWESLVSADLPALAESWFDRKRELETSAALKHFNDKLIREWAIEAGTLEKLYEIDRGVTMTLIEQGLDASLIPFGTTNKPVELVARILNDHKEAIEGVFAFVKQERDLSIGYIKELHQSLLRSQSTTEAVDQFGNVKQVELIKGDWKKLPNNPTRADGYTHEYCPPIYVQDEMQKLVKWHAEHEANHVSPEVEAAWLHHRFTQIHPFHDGNGRVARALASLVLIRAGWFPLVFLGDKRVEYINALERADHGNLKPLVDLFARVQRQAFVRALSLSEDVMTDKLEHQIQNIISAAGKVLGDRRQADIQERRKISRLLEDTAEQFFNDVVAPALRKELQARDREYWVNVARSTEGTEDWYHRQIIEVAKKLEYFADWRTYRAWVGMKIKEERIAHIVLSFHCLGKKSKDLMAASAFIEYRDRTEELEEPEGPYELCVAPFQYSVKENTTSLVRRFRAWLNQVTVAGLDQWRRQL
ncbi:MAG TPA: Fic family protein [Candidatus Obscuribacterales bacterium]